MPTSTSFTPDPDRPLSDRYPDDLEPDDLEPHETAVAEWLGGLERATPPETLRLRVLEARPVVAGRVRPQWTRWSALAAAAVVVAAVGWVGFGARGTGSGTGSGLRTSVDAPVIVIDDSLGQMHALETFDHVGFEERSELIAHWGD